MHAHLPTHVHVYRRQDLKLGTTYNEKKEEIFGETALELAENRIWALDLENKGSGSPTQLAPKKLSLPALFSRSFGEEGKAGLWEHLKPVTSTASSVSSASYGGSEH